MASLLLKLRALAEILSQSNIGMRILYLIAGILSGITISIFFLLPKVPEREISSSRETRSRGTVITREVITSKSDGSKVENRVITEIKEVRETEKLTDKYPVISSKKPRNIVSFYLDMTGTPTSVQYSYRVYDAFFAGLQVDRQGKITSGITYVFGE